MPFSHVMTLHNVSVFPHWNWRIEVQKQKQNLEKHIEFSTIMLVIIYENDYLHFMFSFTNKKVTDVWNSEMDSMKKISRVADFLFLQQETADVLLLGVRIRHFMTPTVLPHRIPYSSIFLIWASSSSRIHVQYSLVNHSIKKWGFINLERWTIT